MNPTWPPYLVVRMARWLDLPALHEPHMAPILGGEDGQMAGPASPLLRNAVPGLEGVILCIDSQSSHLDPLHLVVEPGIPIVISHTGVAKHLGSKSTIKLSHCLAGEHMFQ